MLEVLIVIFVLMLIIMWWPDGSRTSGGYADSGDYPEVEREMREAHQRRLDDMGQPRYFDSPNISAPRVTGRRANTPNVKIERWIQVKPRDEDRW